RGEIVVFADARQRFEPQTVRELVANFADPSVGGASGELVLAAHDGTAAAGHGTAFYWRYEKFIRSTEGRADSTIGATGAIYAIRRDLFEPIPDDTLLDDVLIPLRIVRRGYRVVFEPNARAYDRASSTARQEFVRKTRTIAGMFQLIAREGWLLNPLRNRLWFETISHKVLRVALPALHAVVLVSNVLLADAGFYGLMLALQAMFYCAAAVGLTQRDARRRSLVFTAPSAMCLLLWATVVGFFRFITNRQQVTWERVTAPAAQRDVAASRWGPPSGGPPPSVSLLTISAVCTASNPPDAPPRTGRWPSCPTTRPAPRPSTRRRRSRRCAPSRWYRRRSRARGGRRPSRRCSCRRRRRSSRSSRRFR